MPFHKFGSNDIFYNRIETHPQVNFIIYDQSVYYNNKSRDSGSYVENAGHIPTGHISLYELNIDRKTFGVSQPYIRPYVVKQGSLYDFKTTTTTQHNIDFLYGDTIYGSYPLSASISSDRYAYNEPVPFAIDNGGNLAASITSLGRNRLYSLKTALDSYQILSPHYAYSSSLGDKAIQEMRLISIPSIFYGSSIQKGSVSCKFYVSGTLIGELRDNMQNGELRQMSSSTDGTTETASGSIAGVVMYNEGFLILTGSWPLESYQEAYLCGDGMNPRWIEFGGTGSTDCNIPSSSFALNFSGTNYVPTVTMLAQAPLSTINFSNNPTAIAYNPPLAPTASSGSTAYIEFPDTPIKNIVSSSWSDPEASFKRTVYINYVGVYDEKRNLIGIAKMANPVRKRDQDDFTFKLKLDF